MEPPVLIGRSGRMDVFKGCATVGEILEFAAFCCKKIINTFLLDRASELELS